SAFPLFGLFFQTRLFGLRDIDLDPEADLVDQVRCVSALFTLHAGMFVLRDLEGDPEEQRAAVLEVATDLITQAHRGAAGA
ncbi:TetR family transcriptional regulator, partial [Streptomyces ardesiacus]